MQSENQISNQTESITNGNEHDEHDEHAENCDCKCHDEHKSDYFAMTLENIQGMFNADEHIYPYMKSHFADVCSNGDCIIHDLLDALNENRMINEKDRDEVFGKIIKSFKIDQDSINFYLGYIVNVHNNRYVKGLEPDPWWAD